MASHSWSGSLYTFSRRLRTAIALPLLLPFIGLIASTAMQAEGKVTAKNGATFKVIPMTERELYLGIAMGQGFLCKARSMDVEIRKALETSVSTVAGIIKIMYDSELVFGGKVEKLTDKNLYNMVNTEVILRAYKSCPQYLTDEIKVEAKRVQIKMNEIYNKSRKEQLRE